MRAGCRSVCRLVLEPLEGCSRWERGPLWPGEATFAFLPAGEYRLTLCRCGCSPCRLLVRLSPDSNVELALDGEGGRLGWRLNPMHCAYNAEG